eukprot:12057559-Alexandrium_andersonii.AAC.1
MALSQCSIKAVQQELVLRSFRGQLRQLPPLHDPTGLADEFDTLPVVGPRTEAAQLRDLQVGVGSQRRGQGVPALASGAEVHVRSDAEETKGPHSARGGG